MKKVILLMTIAMLWFALAGAMQAVEEEHHGSSWDVFFRWVNFIILFGGLGYLLRRPVQDFFENRRNSIATGLDRASRAQQDAQSRMSDIEERLSRLSADIETLRREAERESVAEREKIVAEAKREVERAVEQSRREIERVARSAERDIKQSVADLVVDRASQALRMQMTEGDHKRITVRFIEKL